ncbi:MAG TPA: long-chain fatty acid--CoA ligase [Candidatus Marinimicrobia bacterium]|nr:long-chain fatty acid--CoA ligase [Candidatus Neomarinimicrobiota bacterium]
MSFKTIPGMFQSLVEEKPNLKTFFTKGENGWEGIELIDLQKSVEDFANGLKNLGINKYDKVAIIGANSRQWAISDYAIAHTRAVSVPVYPTLIPAQSRYVVEHSESKIAIVQDALQLDKVYSLIGDTNASLNTIIIMDDNYDGNKEHVVKFSEVFEMKNEVHDIRELSKTVMEDDLLTLIYTSGTTGSPKGVMLSHANICNNLLSIDHLIKKAMDLNPELKPEDGIERFISFLPISHSFERVGGHYSIFSQGTQIYYAEMNFTPEILFENIREVQPTFLTAVPRIFEKIHGKIIDSVSAMTGVKKTLAEWSINVGMQTVPYRQVSKKLPFVLGLKYNIADKLVLNKFRAALGGKVRACSSGGSALSKEVGSFFCGIGISIIEGYGLTETSPVMTLGNPDFFKFGTVGNAIPGVEVKIAEDGEILCRGHCVMQGYYKNEEATNEAIVDGWFHSGDIGKFDEDGLLRITDRKKSLIITSGGKNVAPQPMEVSLTSSKYIEQCNVVGDDRNFISALIVPNKESLMTWAEDKGLASLDYKSLCAHPDAYDMIDIIVKDVMTNFSRYESIRKFVLIHEEWTVDAGELTPKMSIKRKVVTTKHKDQIDEMYNPKNAPEKSSDDSGHLGG